MLKVQGVVLLFKRRYILYSLAKDVENSNGEVLGKVVNTIKQEIESLNGDRHHDWSDIKKPKDPLEEFRADVESAENGAVSW